MCAEAYSSQHCDVIALNASIRIIYLQTASSAFKLLTHFIIPFTLEKLGIVVFHGSIGDLVLKEASFVNTRADVEVKLLSVSIEDLEDNEG